MNLLATLPFEGYPPAYLLARVRARRSGLIRDWPACIDRGVPAGTSAGDLWGELVREFGWLYRQMDSEYRRIFAPVFTVFELRTLILCLRQRQARNNAKVEELLALSLLAPSVKKPLRTATDLQGALAGLEERLACETPIFTGLAQIGVDQGLKGVEEVLTRNYLIDTLRGKLHPLVRRLLIELVDLRNLLILYKHLRWKLGTPPAFLEGGSLPPGKLQAAWETGDLTAFVASREDISDSFMGIDAGVLETVLLRRISARLKRQGKFIEGVGPVLDYLWRCYTETRNLGVLRHGRDLPKETLAAELIA